MKSKLLTLTLLLAFSGGLFAQSAAQTERMERRAARKARQAAELAQSRAEMIKLVKDTTFVIEANTFIGPFGQESPVSSFQNYFAIIGDKVAISISFDNPPSSQMSPLAWYGPGSGVPGIGPGYSDPGFPGWNWQSWDTPNTPATLVSYQSDLSQPDGPFTIVGSFRTWTGVIPVSFKIYIQENGTGRIIFYSNDGGQVTFTGDVVSPENAYTIYPLP
ncbi:MAG: hypothetical protein IKU01_08830 [Bacteroidales bacterium]|nr:hypothetical protein [Bacteroidales bacterium]